MPPNEQSQAEAVVSKQFPRKFLKLSKASGTTKTQSSDSEDETSVKKIKKKKKSKKSKKSSKTSSDEDRESGELSSFSDAGSDANKELAAALLQQEKSEGIWGQIFSGLHSHDLETLMETSEIFASIEKPLYDVIYQGGYVIVNLNKSIKSLARKWSILKSSFDKKKSRLPRKERDNIENMIKASIKFLEDWLENFSANSYAKAAISAIISRYEDRVFKSLIGARTAKQIIVKLKGLLKAHHQLQNVSWAKLCNWSPEKRGFKGANNHRNNNRGRGNKGRYSNAGYNQNYGYYGNFDGYGGYGGYGGFGGSGGTSYGGYGESNFNGSGSNRPQGKASAKPENRQSGSRM